jgi:hypothetical protein
LIPGAEEDPANTGMAKANRKTRLDRVSREVIITPSLLENMQTFGIAVNSSDVALLVWVPDPALFFIKVSRFR